MAVYTTIDNPELFFQCKTYSGDGTAIGSGGQAITLDGSEDMQPDIVWVKSRTDSQNHNLSDSVRGGTKTIYVNSSYFQETKTEAIASFQSDGFTVGNWEQVNDSGDTFVAWCWKAGTSFTNDASSTGIGTIDSAGSFNNSNGVSIFTYTGTGSAASLKHGLSSAPSVFVIKNLSSASTDWRSFTEMTGSGSQLSWSQNSPPDSGNTAMWNSTSPTSSVLTIGTHGNVNTSSDNFVGYCFSQKQGFAKMGTYFGNGSTDGTYQHLGFRAAYIMVKNLAAGTTFDWNIWDNKRFGCNGKQPTLFANLTNSEDTEYARLDILANGFKTRINNGQLNTNGHEYFFMAFAESPFVNSNGVPNNAR